MPNAKERFSIFSSRSLRLAAWESLKKLNPRAQVANPVIFLVYLGSLFVTALWVASLLGINPEPAWFPGTVAVWLWLTVIFSNFAEALAEGQARAQTQQLRLRRQSTAAFRLQPQDPQEWEPGCTGTTVDSSQLVRGDIVLVTAGELIPCDGEVVKGIASVNESAVTGESAPVIRSAESDACKVTGGTTVLSDWIVVRCDSAQGDSFLDQMISMVETAARKKTPTESALSILLYTLCIIFILSTVTLLPFSQWTVLENGAGNVVSLTVLVALLVCLAPTTIGGLLSAIGVAGMTRLLRSNVVAYSGRAVEAAGDVDILLVDKTGTITYGNRQANGFWTAPGVLRSELVQAALYASSADDTPEGHSIVVLARNILGDKAQLTLPANATWVPFSAQSRMSGVNLGDRHIRKGAPDAISRWIEAQGGRLSSAVRGIADQVASRGSTPLVVAEDGRELGVIELKDIVKPGIRKRFAQLRRMGIRSVMMTGDNPLTAATIASEAGIDGFLAEVTPEGKLERIRELQEEGHVVAMTGDATNDAPALAQAEVALAMNSGTPEAKQAANLVDLDSSPTKLIEVVRIGKQMLMTRGALTTFSIANDVAKYFAIIPAAFASTYPGLGLLNLMHLSSPTSALISSVIFNALIIVAMLPVALRGVQFRPMPPDRLLRRFLLLYGVGGLVVPFVGIKLIDWALVLVGWG